MFAVNAMSDDKAPIIEALGCISTADKMTVEIVDSTHFVRALNRALKTWTWRR